LFEFAKTKPTICSTQRNSLCPLLSHIKMCLFAKSSKYIYSQGAVKKLLSIKLWTSQRAWHHNNLKISLKPKNLKFFDNCKVKCFLHFHTYKSIYWVLTVSGINLRKERNGWTWIMLSDEWKMRMGNECEVSVCWLESALPNLTKVESEKERGSRITITKLCKEWK
jgi:hypothetical protein